MEPTIFVLVENDSSSADQIALLFVVNQVEKSRFN